MTRYLLDTNHLSALLDRNRAVEPRIDSALLNGDRFGVTLPVLCEYRAGIAGGTRRRRNVARLQMAMKTLRLWPVDEQTTIEFGTLFEELRQAGRMLSSFDLLIAASARQLNLTLLTADSDFQDVSGLHVENWLVSSA